MIRILRIARHDLHQALVDRGGAIFMFLLPVVFATFFGLVMGGGGAPKDAKARLTVIDEDGGPLARLLRRELESERLQLVAVDPEAKESTPDKVRTLVIPAGFSERVQAGDQMTLRLEKDPDTSSEATLLAQARILSAIARTLGTLIEQADAEASSFGVINLDAPSPPDLVRIESRFAGRAEMAPEGFAQSVPGNAVMFVMLVAMTYGAASIAAERGQGQLRRLATTPVSPSEIVMGKIVGRFVIAAAQITVLVLVAFAARELLGVEVGRNLAAVWVILLFFGAAVAPLGVLFGAWIRDPDRAASIGVLATMAMAAFGGCWWPLEVVSDSMRALAMSLPTGWAMTALHRVISFGEGIGSTLPLLGLLTGFAIVLSIAAGRTLRIE